MSEHPTVFPALHYGDPKAALDFLVAAFGAEPHAVYSNDDGTMIHAEVRFGNGMIMFGGGESRGGEVYVVVDSPDALFERARAAGAEITREPHDTDYGSREFGARDLEGNAWSFGTYQPFDVAPSN